MPSAPSWLEASVPAGCPSNPRRNQNDHRHRRADWRHFARGHTAAGRAVLKVQDFNVRSIKEWVAAIEGSGAADADAISAAEQVALAQFAPDLVRPE
jgi:hypothetical protein